MTMIQDSNIANVAEEKLRDNVAKLKVPYFVPILSAKCQFHDWQRKLVLNKNKIRNNEDRNLDIDYLFNASTLYACTICNFVVFEQVEVLM